MVKGDDWIMAPSTPKVFVREATGLVKGLNWFDGMIMNLAYFNIAAASFLIFGLGSFLFPGSNMVISIGIVGLIIDIPIVITYSMFAASMPRSGGDYVYVSRALSPPLGFATGLVFFLFLSIFSVGQNAWFATTLGMAPILAAIGSLSSNPGLVSLSQVIVQPLPSIGIGLVLILVTFVLLLIPTSVLHRIMFTLFVIGFLGYPILYTVVLASSSNAQFITAFNSYASQFNTSYNAIISSAQGAGASIVAPTLGASLAALPIIYATLAFPQSSVYVGGETKRAIKQIPLSLVAGLLVICIFTAIMGYYTYNVFGYNFISATAYYGFSGASGYPLPAAPYTDYFEAILFPNLAFNWFMLISTTAWELLLMITFGLMAARFLFAAAFDRVVPTALADVNDRFHTPVKATIIAMLGSVVFLVLTAFSFLGTYVNSIIAWTSGYIVVMIAGICYPFLRKEIFAGSPSFVSKRIGGLPIISLFGGIGTISLLIVIYYLILEPSVSGASANGIGIVVAVYVIAIGLYYAVKAYRKRMGLDLGLVFKEIPPE